MNIFLTGATGYIGSAIAQALLAAGHGVTGLARSQESVRQLEVAGITPLRGSLEEQERLVAGARGADGVIHAAFDVSAPAPHLLDSQVMETFLRTLSGSDKALVYTSGLMVLGSTGEAIVDEDAPPKLVAIVAWSPVLEERVLKASRLRCFYQHPYQSPQQELWETGPVEWFVIIRTDPPARRRKHRYIF